MTRKTLLDRALLAGAILLGTLCVKPLTPAQEKAPVMRCDTRPLPKIRTQTNFTPFVQNEPMESLEN